MFFLHGIFEILDSIMVASGLHQAKSAATDFALIWYVYLKVVVQRQRTGVQINLAGD